MSQAKRILITGAATGFGKGAAFELARRGHHVIAGTYDEAQKTNLLAEAAEAGIDLEVIQLDITKPSCPGSRRSRSAPGRPRAMNLSGSTRRRSDRHKMISCPSTWLTSPWH